MQKEVTNYERSFFTIDIGAEKEIKYHGFHDPEYQWNGWAVPHFTKDVAIQIMKDFNDNVSPRQLEKMVFVGNPAAIVYTDYEGDETVCELTEIEVEGEKIEVYDLSLGWVWCAVSRQTQEEINKVFAEFNQHVAVKMGVASLSRFNHDNTNPFAALRPRRTSEEFIHYLHKAIEQQEDADFCKVKNVIAGEYGESLLIVVDLVDSHDQVAEAEYQLYCCNIY